MVNDIVTDKDLIYFYFEMIGSSGAKSVLDIGMFLKKTGAISRQVMGAEIDPDVKLVGVDLLPDAHFAVYDRVYDEVILDDYFYNKVIKENKDSKEKYDIASLLALNEMDPDDARKVWIYVLEHARTIMTEQSTAMIQVQQGLIKGYYPVSTGENTYAWIPTAELRGM